MRKKIIILAVLAVYLVAYVALRAAIKPAANMAYFIYAEDTRADQLCYGLFWPAYRTHQEAWRLLSRPFIRHNRDRPAALGESAPL